MRCQFNLWDVIGIFPRTHNVAEILFTALLAFITCVRNCNNFPRHKNCSYVAEFYFYGLQVSRSWVSRVDYSGYVMLEIYW